MNPLTSIPVYSQYCVTCQMVYLFKYLMEFREIFGVVAKWLDNNGYTISWQSLDNWLTGYRKADFNFGPSSTVGQGAALCSEGSMFRRSYIPKVLYSEVSMLRRFYIPKVLCSKNPLPTAFFYQLNIHGPGIPVNDDCACEKLGDISTLA